MNDIRSTIFIVDDDPVFRKSLVRLIRSSGYSETAFSSADEFLKVSHPERPACLLLDYNMPGMNGLELQKRLNSSQDRDIPIIFITGEDDVPLSVKAMKGGAIDFLPKPFKPEELLNAVRAAIEKNKENLVNKNRTDQVGKLVSSLTPREYEVFSLVVTGMLNKQIADKLNISEKTVKIHRARVMSKMAAQSFADLVHLGGEAGIPSPEKPNQS
jgi:two-component system, LuxR family, response regulator FixJ